MQHRVTDDPDLANFRCHPTSLERPNPGTDDRPHDQYGMGRARSARAGGGAYAHC
jgi:hypothetical protein